MKVGLDGALGTEIVSASGQLVVLRLRIGAQHLQPYGIVHGGVWAVLAETAASIGASLNSSRRVVGMENHTSFLRAIGEGEILAVARPVHAGRTTQAWRVEIGTGELPEEVPTNLVAWSMVRLYVLQDGRPRAAI